mgnify:CR=1 FL=1
MGRRGCAEERWGTREGGHAGAEAQMAAQPQATPAKSAGSRAPSREVQGSSTTPTHAPTCSLPVLQVEIGVVLHQQQVVPAQNHTHKRRQRRACGRAAAPTAAVAGPHDPPSPWPPSAHAPLAQAVHCCAALWQDGAAGGVVRRGDGVQELWEGHGRGACSRGWVANFTYFRCQGRSLPLASSLLRTVAHAHAQPTTIPLGPPTPRACIHRRPQLRQHLLQPLRDDPSLVNRHGDRVQALGLRQAPCGSGGRGGGGAGRRCSRWAGRRLCRQAVYTQAGEVQAVGQAVGRWWSSTVHSRAGAPPRVQPAVASPPHPTPPASTAACESCAHLSPLDSCILRGAASPPYP